MRLENRYRWKIITIAVLIVLILLGLLYLRLLKGGKGISNNTKKPTPEPTAEVTASPTPTPTPTPTPEPTPTPITVDLESDDSINRMLNKDHPVNRDYIPGDLVNVDVKSDGKQLLRKEAAEQLKRMFDDAIDQKIYFKLVSGYRSYSEQEGLYNYYVYRYGRAKADIMDDHPGASEHQLGLAVDLGNWNGQCELNECFVKYPTYTFLQEHAHEYGFIERYPKDKQDITGIAYSPWHYRYVGVEEATRIHESGLTMEEYYGY